jgi:hypothetical protein
MAGSRKWFVYTTDAGDDFALQADESNVEAFAAGTQDYPETGTPPQYAVPRNVTPRHAFFGGTSAETKIKVPIITQTIFNALNNTSTMPDPLDAGNTLNFINKVPEKIRYPRGNDTGKLDGDAT